MRSRSRVVSILGLCSSLVAVCAFGCSGRAANLARYVTSDSDGAKCGECDGMKLLPRVVTFTPVGAVLAVPQSAVIDTGTRRVVYVERSPGLFDGVEVTLGSRCDEFYPVVRGLEAGQRVATNGSFLIDAETRLNPSVAVGYFGAAEPKK